MNLKKLKDAELLAQIQGHGQGERQTLTIILHHLREIERRKLFSELGFQSMFNYMVSELKYSRGEAGRKIQAVRLIKEIPHIEEKIESGAINLTHICQVQSFSYQKNKLEPQSVTTLDKIKILEDIENTSTRESEKIILELSPETSLPKEKERQITPQHTEMKFVINASLKNSLEEVLSLLGTRAIHMTFAELIQEMALLSITSLKTKRFGRKRTASLNSSPAADLNTEEITVIPTISSKTLSQKIKHQVWQRDQGRCTRCSSRHNLNNDHIHPRALGGNHSLENLRLLCFDCNQRRSFVTFGVRENTKHLSLR